MSSTRSDPQARKHVWKKDEGVPFVIQEIRRTDALCESGVKKNYSFHGSARAYGSYDQQSRLLAASSLHDAHAAAATHHATQATAAQRR